MKTLKVKQLIALLHSADQNAEVVLEGCDCASECVGFSFGQDAYKESVILRRESGVFDFDELELVGGVK